MPPPADEAGIRALLGAQPEVLDGGLWFADQVCRTRFAKPRRVAQAELDGFAKCLASLAWTPSPRHSVHDDTAVLVTQAGFELEANVSAGRLKFIGFSGRGEGAPDTPVIAPAKLESLRTAGVAHPVGAKGAAIRLCLDTTGAVASIEPNSLAKTVADWRFAPFLVDNAPMAACAVVALDERSDEVVPLPGLILERDLIEGYRIAGTKRLFPSDVDKDTLAHAHIDKVTGSFQVCLDEHGKPTRVVVLGSTGLPNYDAYIETTIMTTWRYKPYVRDGAPIAVCTAVSFTYSQHGLEIREF